MNQAIVRQLGVETAKWTVVVCVTWSVAATVASAGAWPLHSFVPMVGIAIVFSAFAGGLSTAAFRTGPLVMQWEGWLCLGALGLLVWVTLAYLGPVAAMAALGSDVAAQRNPLGAWTPEALVRLREIIVQDPAPTPVPGADPTRWGVGFVDYLLSGPRAFGTLAVINGALGAVVGHRTLDLAVGARRRLRWMLALMSAFAILGMDEFTRGWVVAAGHDGTLLSGWLVAVPHAMALLAGTVLVWARARDR